MKIKLELFGASRDFSEKDVTEPLIYLLIILFLLGFRIKFQKTS